MSSIYIGVTGMRSYQEGIDVIANNIANVNTVAFKGSNAAFQEMVMHTMNGGTLTTNPMQVGMGVQAGSVDINMGQGALQSTGRTLDLGIAGEGFFEVNDGVSNHFTRDGSMSLDQQNRIVYGATGDQVVGWTADATGKIDTTLPPAAGLSIPLGTKLATATSSVKMSGNLDGSSAVGTHVTATFSDVDSLGAEHAVTVTFAKTGADTWDWAATTPDGTMTAPSGTGSVTFNTDGSYKSGSGAVSFALSTPNGAKDPSFNLDFGSVKQLAGDSNVAMDSQDGLKMGTMTNFSIDGNGVILGTYSNGATRQVGQIAVARFANPSGLVQQGGNYWTTGPNSGAPMLAAASVGGAAIHSGFLEGSNVDLTTEFSNLIVTQRAFEANSRTITTSDEMLQDVLQLKR